MTQSEYGITPEQYHTGLHKLWDALNVTGVQDRDVFTLCAERIRALDCKVRLLHRQIATIERRRPLCPDCRGKCRGEECLRCQIQKLESDNARLARKLSLTEAALMGWMGIDSEDDINWQEQMAEIDEMSRREPIP